MRHAYLVENQAPAGLGETLHVVRAPARTDLLSATLRTAYHPATREAQPFEDLLHQLDAIPSRAS